jgi:Fe-S cluster assembly protein SufD
VIVRPGTVATAAHQRADSLLLHPTAQSDSRPWLEIFADDVRCTHGAAVGRLDEDALFYLRSRGIPEAEARQLLVVAFVDELVSSIELPELRAVAEALIRRTDRP